MEIALIAVIAFLAVITLVLFFKMSKAEKLAGTASINSENLARLTESLINQQAQLEGQLKQISTDSAQSRQEINQTLSERLDTVKKRLGDSLSQSEIGRAHV